MNNYRVLFCLRVLKNVLTIFLDSFLVLYFLNVSNSNILPIGIYKLIAIITIYIVIFATRNLCKSKHRVNLMRIGIMLDLVYFITIIALRENVVNYVYIIGLLYGLEEGFYYSVYNMLETDGVKNKERAKYLGSYTATQSIIAILFPALFGGLIYATGFIEATLVAVGIVVIQIALSFMFKDKNVPKSNKTNFKVFKRLIKDNAIIKDVYKNKFCAALLYSEAAFAYIVTIYIIRVFSDSISLGIFTSVFSLISCALGILFVKIIKPRDYTALMKISTIFVVISLCAMIWNCNMATIIIFNLCNTIFKGLSDLINSRNAGNIANLKAIQREYKVEYFLGIETMLVIARTISHSLFIIMAVTGQMNIIYIFAVFLILYAVSTINLQNKAEQEAS